MVKRKWAVTMLAVVPEHAFTNPLNLRLCFVVIFIAAVDLKQKIQSSSFLHIEFLILFLQNEKRERKKIDVTLFW